MLFFKNQNEDTVIEKALRNKVNDLEQQIDYLEDDHKREISNLNSDHELEIRRKDAQIDVKIMEKRAEDKKKIATLELENGNLKKEVEILTKAFENLGFDVKDMKDILNKLVDGVISKNTIQLVK